MPSGQKTCVEKEKCFVLYRGWDLIFDFGGVHFSSKYL
jgi:hypothetical protein